MLTFIIAVSMSFALARVSGFVRDDCVCGVANTDSRRIIKGTVTEPSKYPWMVALYSTEKKAYCGGALISDKHVLTAAHCLSFEPGATDYWLDIYGKIRIHHTSKGDKIKFQKVQIHPNFRSLKTFDDFDLAILTLPKPIARFRQDLSPICVPTATKNYGGRKAVIAGWGTTTPNGTKMSKTLREGQVTVLHQIQCPAATKLHSFYNFRSMMCGFSPKHVDTCLGDSGGPLIVATTRESFEVIAVASFGYSCGGKYAGIYADITQSLEWIWGIIGQAGVCPSLGDPRLKEIFQ